MNSQKNFSLLGTSDGIPDESMFEVFPGKTSGRAQKEYLEEFQKKKLGSIPVRPSEENLGGAVGILSKATYECISERIPSEILRQSLVKNPE